MSRNAPKDATLNNLFYAGGSVHPGGGIPLALISGIHAAKEIIQNTSSISVSLTRQMLWKMLGADHPMEAHKVDSRFIYELGKGDDAKEGVNSFLEKRPPEFPNKVSKDMPDYYPWWDEKEFS